MGLATTPIRQPSAQDDHFRLVLILLVTGTSIKICVRNTVGGGVRATDDGSKAFLPREAAGLGKVHGVWGGDGDRVDGIPFTDAAWEGNRW